MVPAVEKRHPRQTTDLQTTDLQTSDHQTSDLPTSDLPTSDLLIHIRIPEIRRRKECFLYRPR